MPLAGTTGTEKAARKQQIQFAALEADQPASATASAGAATLNQATGQVTSESLTTAAGATYTLTLTNSDIAATSQLFATVGLGTSTAGQPTVASVVCAAGSATIVIQNIHATNAFNGTIVVGFLLVRKAGAQL
jgi:hypothetical protein